MGQGQGRGHGWEGALLKLFRGRDFLFTVTGSEQVTEHYRRLHLTDGGMLAATGVHPTMFVRLWFDHAGKPHQRCYTLVDPDPAAGTFSLEFALHEGRASDWARAAKPGDTIEATVQGSSFQWPEPEPSHVFAIGDPASLPALNSLIDAVGSAPATIWLETDHGTDGLPLRTDPSRHDLRTVPRLGSGAHLVSQVRAALPELLKDRNPAETYVWIATDTATTRNLAGYFRKELSVPKQRMSALGYWREK
ncbi:siderophore-interacting protein [Streptomyces sp. NPDC050704]|uniref:siderophore-interacting protein n=1 Tax=Streptomyces sp. NPDC050704 TaxID=3157219 RepID=UPI0034173B98